MNHLFSRLNSGERSNEPLRKEKNQSYKQHQKFNPRGGVRTWSACTLRTTKRTFGKEAVGRFEIHRDRIRSNYRSVQSLPEKKGVLCPPGTRVFPGAFFALALNANRNPRVQADRLQSSLCHPFINLDFLHGSMTRITRVSVDDLRFPTSWDQHGSDAMNKDPDYSAAYVTLHTDSTQTGHGLVFTLGRGTDLCVSAVDALKERVEGQSLSDITQNFATFWRELTTGDSQLRWLGPEKGTVHMAAGAIINAIWDLWAKIEGKPLWRLLCELSPETLVKSIDFRYLTDALTPEEALEILNKLEPTRQERIQQLEATGYPAYTTSTGWLGYSDDRLRQLCQEALEAGWNCFKIKVGGDLEQDIHRLTLVREEIGPDRVLMLDANQIWDVGEAIEWMQKLSRFNPLWIEEPTNPDDVVGHQTISKSIQPIGVATGEMGQNRVLFKQLLQLGAIQFCQIDSCRLGGVNEVLSVILMAAKFGVPVCPHGGGVGLCEHIQHLAIFDYVAVSGSLEQRWTEYVDHLHEHFEDPVIIRQGHYQLPTAAGYSLDLKPESIADYKFPDGRVWREHQDCLKS